MRQVIILFARAPIAGRVKTRLQPPLTPEQACRLHTAFVSDLLDRLQSFGGIDLELHTDIRTDVWTQSGVTLRLQVDGDLGLKMVHALSTALAGDCDRAMIVGTDSPTVPLEHLRWLLESSADVALGPTDDGGYYAISCRTAHPDMFQGVEWSTALTLAQTVKAVQACGLTVVLGPQWFDVDEARDLERLAASDALPPHTAEVLRGFRVTY